MFGPPLDRYVSAVLPNVLSAARAGAADTSVTDRIIRITRNAFISRPSRRVDRSASQGPISCPPTGPSDLRNIVLCFSC